MSSKFWLYDPSILLKKEEMMEFWPKEKQSMAEKLNAVTRSILVLTTRIFINKIIQYFSFWSCNSSGSCII